MYVLVPKKGNLSCVNNYYRPISLYTHLLS